ncbi:MAG: YggS family pyridoxal phosphate-dependent enzyme, partial [Pseudomonadota bacterium]
MSEEATTDTTPREAGLEAIQARIEAAAAEAGRAASDVSLIAVSKVQPLERVEAVLKAGHRVFGENRVQEAAGKWPAWREQYPGLELHLIGPLQTNKVRQAVELFDVIQSVDRPKLAKKLADVFEETGRNLPVYLQINTGEEEQKAGVMPEDADAFVAECRG